MTPKQLSIMLLFYRIWLWSLIEFRIDLWPGLFKVKCQNLYSKYWELTKQWLVVVWFIIRTSNDLNILSVKLIIIKIKECYQVSVTWSNCIWMGCFEWNWPWFWKLCKICGSNRAKQNTTDFSPRLYIGQGVPLPPWKFFYCSYGWIRTCKKKIKKVVKMSTFWDAPPPPQLWKFTTFFFEWILP